MLPFLCRLSFSYNTDSASPCAQKHSDSVDYVVQSVNE